MKTEAQEWLDDHDMSDHDGTDLRMPDGEYLDEYLYQSSLADGGFVVRHPGVRYQVGSEPVVFIAELYRFNDGSGILIVDPSLGAWATTDCDGYADRYSPATGTSWVGATPVILSRHIELTATPSAQEDA